MGKDALEVEPQILVPTQAPMGQGGSRCNLRAGKGRRKRRPGHQCRGVHPAVPEKGLRLGLLLPSAFPPLVPLPSPALSLSE